MEYNSDSDAEETLLEIDKRENQDILTRKTQNLPQYRLNIIGESSNEESDSEEDSSTSDSSSCIDNDSSTSDNDLDDSSNRKKKEIKKSTAKQEEIENECDKLPQIEELKITVPENLCLLLGEVAWMVNQLVVVKPKPDAPTLNLDSLLFLDKGKRTLGQIFDVFGSVSEPHFCVRFNSSEHIQDNEIKTGMLVYYCPKETSYTSLVFVHELRKIKGCDVIHDSSTGEAPDFSDDEEEQAYYNKLQQQQQNNTNNTSNLNAGRMQRPSKRMRVSSPARSVNTHSHNTPSSNRKSNRPWNRNNQSQRDYDAWGGSYPAQNEAYTHMAQYPSQSNMYQYSYGPTAYSYGGHYAPFNAARDGYPFYPPFGVLPRFNFTFPLSPMNHSPVHPGARFQRMNAPYSAQPIYKI